MMHFRLFAILLLLVAGSTTVVSGQTQQEPALDMEFTDIPLSEAISRIEKNTRYTFFYDAKQTDLSQRVSLKAKRMPISAALKEMLAPTGLNFTITERQIALIPARKAAARQRTIAGVVNDSSETPLAGVAVTLVGDNTRGAVTEANGSFTLTVPDADITLSFTYLGYVSKKVAVPATQNNVKVFLTEDAVKMEDVVVVGYGTQKKVNLTGAIATVDEKQLQNRSAPSVAHMLQGSVPGLTVSTSSGRPGNPASLNIRGITSINGGSPLVLVDGAEGDLMKINPNDVASISVVKDASAAAIYGSRASNGVILVTTKKGRGNTPRVSYSGSVSVQINSDELPVMSPGEFRTYIDQVYPAGTTTGDKVQSMLGDKNTNWQDLVFRTAISHDHNISLIGNINDRMPYRASVGYTNQQGTLETSKYERGTLDLSLSPNFFDKHLTVNLNAKGVVTSQRYASGGVVGSAAFFNPTIDPYFRNDDGSIDYTTTNGYWNYGSGRGEDFTPNTLLGAGPLSQLYDRDNTARAKRFIGNAQIDYKVHGFEALRFNLNLGLDVSSAKTYDGVNPGSFQAYTDTEARGWGQYSWTTNFRRNHLLEFYANFNKEWDIHHLDVMAGYSWQHFYSSDHSVSYFNETHEQKGEDSRYPFNRQENYLLSFYGRLNYSIASKYLFTVTLRDDASSRFSEDTRWGLFPSGAFAWNIAEENFLKDSRAVSALKLRVGVGQTGQQEIGSNYPYLARYYMSTDVYKTYYMGSAGHMFYLTPGAYDPNIKWETTTTYNVGLDFGFLGGRINGSVDWYLRQTDDLLNSVITPMGSNFGNTVLTNIGSMENKGVEFNLNFIPVQTKDWNLTVGFNGTFQHTEFTKLNNTDDPDYNIQTGSITKGTGNLLQIHKVGYAPYTFYCFQQLYDQDGNPIQNALVDRDKDGKITQADRYMTDKSPNPDFFYGISLKLNYKNWDFGFNGHGSAGNWVFNDFASANSTSNIDINAGNLPNFARLVKKTGFTKANSGEQWYSDMFLENASFFRMDDINLGYTFNKIGNWKGSMRVAFGVQNVFVITDYSGVDPEIPGVNGIDGSIWPRPRTYSLRLNVNF